MKIYTFKSERLGFRNWKEEDFDAMISISANKKVMRFFPATATPEQTITFIKRMQVSFNEKGYCYFAVDELKTGKLIGFIGMCDQSNDVSFSPYTDIGWRLHPDFWNKGYATEGAKACLKFAFEDLGIDTLLATTPVINLPSKNVMKKIGMVHKLTYKNPSLKNHKTIEECVCYEINHAIFQ